MKIKYICLVLMFFALLCNIEAQVESDDQEEYNKRKKREDSLFFAQKRLEEQKFSQKQDSLYNAYVESEKERYQIYNTEDDVIDELVEKAENIEDDLITEKITIEESVSSLEDGQKPDATTVEVEEYSKPVPEKLNIVSIPTDDLNKQIEANLPVFVPLPKDSYRLGNGFDRNRLHPILKVRRPHEGIDFSCKEGVEIYAVTDGIIKHSAKSNSAGEWIVINHQNGYTTSYLHLSKRIVLKGVEVKKGEIIGYVGSTGLSTGNHLHYEIRRKGTAINPYPFMQRHF